MSLFIGLPAFPRSGELQGDVKVSVLAGSLLSALVGAMLLGAAPRRRADDPRPRNPD